MLVDYQLREAILTAYLGKAKMLRSIFTFLLFALLDFFNFIYTYHWKSSLTPFTPPLTVVLCFTAVYSKKVYFAMHFTHVYTAFAFYVTNFSFRNHATLRYLCHVLRTDMTLFSVALFYLLSQNCLLFL